MDEDDPLSALRHLQPRPSLPDDKTRLLLEAGLEAVTAAFQDRPQSQEMPLAVVWPSQDSVMERYRERVGDRRVTRAVMEYRWKCMPDFYADLFAWALHPSHYAVEQQLSQEAPGVVEAVPDFGDAAFRIARADLDTVFGTPILRIKLLICVSHPVPKAFDESLARFYEAATTWWSGAYASVIAAMGLELRPEIPLRTFATLMTAIEEGLALRYLARPAEFGHDLDALADTLAKGALALLKGSTQNPGDDTTLAAFFTGRLTAPPAP
ncbi:hypothetical protein [Actinocorallia herbida]|nr:hypothetical protein [Actinocorallia herbida]